LIAAAPAAASDPLATWLDGVAGCTASRIVTLAIIGVEPAQTIVSQEQAEEARLAIESRLQATGRVRLSAAADVTRVKALGEGTSALSAQEAEAQIRAAFDGGAAVFFVAPDRVGDPDRLSFRLQAITRRADCKATSERVSVELRRSPQVADIDQALRRAVEAFGAGEGGRQASSVAICPASAPSGGHSSCGAAIADRLALALGAEAANPNRILTDRPLAVLRGDPATCAPGGRGEEGFTAHVSFDRDRAGRSWMSAEFRRRSDGAVFAPTGRTGIAVESLGCDPTMRPFLDHVAATARTNREILDLQPLATPFARGQRLDVRIEASARMQLYCWVLDGDESGFVALPVRGKEQKAAIGPRTTRRYPANFDLADIVLNGPFDNLFGCFGLERGLPEPLSSRWMATAPSADADATLLRGPQILDLLDRIREVPGVVEATARLVVR